jgi:photosystem II stability/assembly factor-like uncharacterized protein
VATASSGLFKTVNGGTTFKAVWDDGSTVSMGSVAICQSKPNVVYIGTGEQSSRNSVSWGDGVYKSVDGGTSWKHLGLTETRHISKIWVDPKNPDLVYVAAIGRLWGRSKERGLYRSKDGGTTWEMVLHVGERAGVIDLDVDPKNPKNMIACTWDRIRYPWVFASGGPESAMWKSADGGNTWRKIGKGLPNTVHGRIAVEIYPKNPKMMVALVEFDKSVLTGTPNPTSGRNEQEDNLNLDGTVKATPGPLPELFPQTDQFMAQNQGSAGNQGTRPTPPRDPRFAPVAGTQMDGGGLFMSKDGGESWELLRLVNPRPFYFSNPKIDPNDFNTIYVGGVGILRTNDLGKNWRTVGSSTHADHHVFWINPNDSNHVMTGCDGGVYVSRDNAATFTHLNNMALGQFYAVSYDGQYPYWVYGGLQDNGSWALPSQNSRGGIGPWDAQSLNGGDGFYVEADTVESEWVYAESQGGAVSRINRKTGQRRGITPRLPDERMRYNWNTPIHISPHDNKTVYIGSHRLMKSTNRGDAFVPISPDLTTNNLKKINTADLSKVLSIRAESTGAENHCTIVTISESPLVKNQIAVGTDDGLIQVTTNGGETWTEVSQNIIGHPAELWCSRVVMSKWDKNRLYATFDGHRSNDFKSYVYVSEDLGKSWRSLSSSLPDWDTVHVIREGEHNPNLLILGSEMALRFSVDKGATWSRLRGKFPTVAVNDIRVHPTMKDLVIGTHGRSIWTVDIAALEGMGSEIPTQPTLLGTSPGVTIPFVSGNPIDGDFFYVSNNNQPNARIYYYLPNDVPDTVSIVVRTPDGREYMVNNPTGSNTKGLKVATWNPRIDGAPAAAGVYEVRVRLDGKEHKTTLHVIAPKSF